MVRKKGSLLLETIIASGVLLTVILAFSILVLSVRTYFFREIDRLIVYNLAYTKAKEIQGNIETYQWTNFDFSKYYGFPFDCGSSSDMGIGDDTSSVPGTFSDMGHPEVRYQFYFVPVPDQSGQPYSKLVGVYLRVWKYATWRQATNNFSLINVDYYFEVRRD
ncbi:MAG: hypothetical protein QXP36_02435 [Conexivisphaerales archaeon]